MLAPQKPGAAPGPALSPAEGPSGGREGSVFQTQLSPAGESDLTLPCHDAKAGEGEAGTVASIPHPRHPSARTRGDTQLSQALGVRILGTAEAPSNHQ